MNDLLADVDDFRDTFAYDLTGNRVQTTRDLGNDGTVDRTTEYLYDVNDRLQVERLDADSNGTVDQTTSYLYDATQQTGKSVSSATSGLLSDQAFAYDLQGRMSQVTTEGYTAGTLSSRDRVSYRYNADGIRVHAAEESDTTLDPTTATWTLTATTDYLVDPHNHTGYAQVLVETVTDAAGTVTSQKVFTIGHDVIAQAEVVAGATGEGVFTLLYDGHGSTRLLTNEAGTIAIAIVEFGTVLAPQIFRFDAYGNAFGFSPSQAVTGMCAAGPAQKTCSRTACQSIAAPSAPKTPKNTTTPAPTRNERAVPQMYKQVPQTANAMISEPNME